MASRSTTASFDTRQSLNGGPDPVHPLIRGVLVGRERELAALRGGFDDARRGEGRLYLLLGAAGIGKTRLAEEIARHVQGTDGRVFWGRCWEGGGAPAYWPWIEAIRAWLRDPDATDGIAGLETAAADVGQVIPELRDRFPDLPAPTAPADPERARFHLFDAIGALLRNVASRRPLLVVLDDLHAADSPSLLLLQFLARELRDAPILLIGCARDRELRQAPELGSVVSEIMRDARQITLQGLSESDVGHFIEATYACPATTSVVTAVHRATDGNPFFLDEVVRQLAASGRLDALPEGRLPIPEGVREAVRRRLRPVGSGCLRTLEIAAAVGDEFDVARLSRIAEHPPRSIVELLSEALEAGVVVERPGRLGRYAFAHALIRETLYNDLSPARRLDLHLQIGEAVEALAGAQVDAHLAELAHHFFQAAPGGSSAKAVDYCRRAGEQAARQLAGEQAAQHFEHALQALALSPADDRQRCELQLALGEALEHAGDFAQARQAFGEAATLARHLGDHEALARAALGTGGLWALKHSSSIFERSDVPLLEEALASLPGGESELRSRLLARLGMALCFAGATDRGEEITRQALDMARRLGDVQAISRALSARHAVLLAPDHLEARLEVSSEMVRLAQETKDRELALRGHVLRIFDLNELGEVAAAEVEARHHARLAEEFRDPFEQWFSRMHAAAIALFRSTLDDADRLSHEALDISRRVPGQHAHPENAGMCFELQRALIGRERAVFDMEPEVRAFAEGYPHVVAWRVVLAMLQLEQGKLAEVTRELDALTYGEFRGLPRDAVWLGTTCILAEMAATVCHREAGEMLYALLLPFRDRNASLTTPALLGSVSRHLGLLCDLLGRDDEAVEFFEAALAMNTRMRSALWTGHTQADYARFLSSRGRNGDAQRAGALCTAARLTALAVGSTRLERRVAALSSPPAADDGPPADESSIEPVFRREGQFWTIAYDRDVIRLRHAKGLVCLGHLLRHPGRDFHALELMSLVDGGSDRPSGRADVEGLQRDRDGGSQQADLQALTSYRGRLREVADEIEELEAAGDTGRVGRLREEAAFLERELARGWGLGDRARRSGSAAERARLNVTRAIKVVLVHIAEHHRELGTHLARTVRTGTFCVYDPDPRSVPRWRT